MRREVVILALLGCALTSTAGAAYTIDGNLSDWGVTPFSQCVPNRSSIPASSSGMASSLCLFATALTTACS